MILIDNLFHGPMSESLTISKLNNTFIKIDTSDDINRELHERFSFFAEGYKHHPKFKARLWNGKIYLYNMGTKLIYSGLISEILKFAADRGYNVTLKSAVRDMFHYNMSKEEFVEFTKTFPISREGEVAQYRPAQLLAIYKAITSKRLTIIAPTGTGKSLIIYGLIRWLQEQTPEKILLVVPNVGLVEQMFSDFKEYSELDEEWDIFEHASRLYSDYDYDGSKQVLISTWQSLQKWETEDHDQWGAVIIDETHGAKAKEVKKILESSVNAEYRFGLTGTLDGQQVNELVIKGLIGPIFKVQTTKQAMEEGTLSGLSITCLELKYDSDTKEYFKKLKPNYQKEIEYICEYERRNKYIANLAKKLEGNTLILFTRVEKHGKILYDLINNDVGDDRKVFFIHGGVDASDREEMRHIVKKENNAIICASFGTMSTGTNIPNIHNIIFASPYKSVVKVLQSIGRGLRKSEGKEECKLFDIVDNVNDKNFSYNHFKERVRIYSNQEFKFRIIECPI